MSFSTGRSTSRIIQRLYPRTGRLVSCAPSNLDTTVQEFPGSIDSYRDERDDTGDRMLATFTGDPNDTEGDADYRVTHFLQELQSTETIAAVRFGGRARVYTGNGMPPQTTNDTGFCIPAMNALSAATPPGGILVLMGTSGWVNWSYDYPTFHSDFGGAGQPWTREIVNAHRFGCHIGPVFASPTLEIRSVAFWLDVLRAA